MFHLFSRAYHLNPHTFIEKQVEKQLGCFLGKKQTRKEPQSPSESFMLQDIDLKQTNKAPKTPNSTNAGPNPHPPHGEIIVPSLLQEASSHFFNEINEAEKNTTNPRLSKPGYETRQISACSRDCFHCFWITVREGPGRGAVARGRVSRDTRPCWRGRDLTDPRMYPQGLAAVTGSLEAQALGPKSTLEILKKVLEVGKAAAHSPTRKGSRALACT